MIRKFGLPLAAVGMLFFAVFHVVRAQQQPPKMEPPVTPSRSPFGKGVAGAGIVEAQTENISVGSHLVGIVTKVRVKVGDKVKKGDVLFELDDRQLKAERQLREAQLKVAKAQRDRLKKMPRAEEVPAYVARVREAEANLADMQDLYLRARRLLGSKAISEEEKMRREQAAKVASAQLTKAKADLKLLNAGAWKEDISVAQANVDQAEAQLNQTNTELKRLHVEAQVDGEVLQVTVRPGECVSNLPGHTYMVLGNLDRLHVRVDIDEHDIPRFERGQKAKAMLRGDPRREFELKYVRVEPYVIPKKSLTGDNTERVDTRVLQVIYVVERAKSPLYVGQQLDVYIDGAKKAN